MGTILVFCALLVSQGDVPKEKQATAFDAVGWAISDIATVPEADRPFQRYLWIPPWGSDEWPGAINFTVNTACSSARTLQFGQVVANGWLMRFDLRRLAPGTDELLQLRSTWDSLAENDPYFHVPAANSNLKAAILAPHLSSQRSASLADLSFSTGGIYRADWFMVKALSTVEGGKYYEFTGAKSKQSAKTETIIVNGKQVQRQVETSVKQSDQAEWLKKHGVFEATTRDLAADGRAGIFRSAVTGKPRRIDWLYGLNRGNPASITRDLADEDIRAENHPIRNLVDIKDSAREVIVQKANGLHAFALFNAKGELQDTVPDSIAKDHTIPAPHTARLQPAISCIRCHGPHDGWIPFANDVQTLLASRLDVFSDISRVTKRTREEIVDELASQYGGALDVPDGPVGRARRDYSTKVFVLLNQTKPFTLDADNNGKKPVGHVSDLIGRIYSRYRYDVVTPEIAAEELGGGKLAEIIGEPLVGSSVDPIEGTLRAGIPINRSDFELVYADLAAKIAARKVLVKEPENDGKTP